MQDGSMAKNFRKDRQAYNHVGKLLDQQLAKQGNNDYFPAVEELVNEGKLGPFQGKYRAGKLLRADSRFASGDQMYDSLLVAGYGQDLARRRGSNSQQYLPTAPDSIQSVDLRQALEALQAGEQGVKVKRNANYGYSKNDYERMQIKPEFAENTPGIVDATINNPLLQQLLSDRAMASRLI